MGEVFLGGTCGESTWRHKIAIPALTAAGLSYYNPQCGPGEWTPELIPIEAAAKDGASCQLFVITGETRGIASMIEAAELLARGVSIVLCLESYTADEPDSQDINRGRKYLLEVSSRPGCAVHNSVAGATSEVIQHVLDSRRSCNIPQDSSILSINQETVLSLTPTRTWNIPQPRAALCNSFSSSGNRVPEVFLGGTCGESTWRHKIAIPALTAAGVSYYNPQCGPGEWTPELIPIEAAAKDWASCQLFVITGETRGIASMIEAAELLARGVSIVLCPEPYTANEPDNQDINRGRKYLLEVASRHGCAVHNSVAGATSEVIQRIRALPF